jgi:glycosyltransferase involved in cell wall biosynthesis
MNKNVSIIIPTFNRADFLVECIDSCLAQTQSCEIIVCDHGSTDNTPEVVKKYGNQIKYIRRELDSGVHFCWLDGILHATNDLIHINYDDDWIYPTYIEECQQLFHENVGCVFSDAIAYHHDEKKFGRKDQLGKNHQYKVKLGFHSFLLKIEFILIISRIIFFCAFIKLN